MVIVSGSLPSISGGYEIGIGRDVESISTSITATWSWYNKMMGTVSWNFKNNSMYQETAVLYRSGYYFGGAFYEIYLANDTTSWAKQLSPLMNRGTERNVMPLGIVDFGKGQRTIAFLFTLDPGQSWSVLEGGFTSRAPPSNAVLYGVRFEKAGSFCIGYDPKQVEDYDRQTSTSLRGFSPNPDSVRTVEVTISSFAPYVQIFPKDTIADGVCSTKGETVIEERRDVASGDIEEIVGNIIRKIRSF